MSPKERKDIESRLSHYSIPIQILQMVAENCGCHAISAETRIKGSGRNASSLPLLAALDDKSIMLLEKIFLDCHDSFSNLRLAVFMSSKWPSAQHKFVMAGAVRGASGQAHAFDVCIYDRDTEELVAIGMQNNDAGQKASSNGSVRRFLHSVSDLHAAHPRLHSAFYASSYGYEDKSPSRVVKQVQAKGGCGDVDIRLLEYQKTVYFENRS